MKKIIFAAVSLLALATVMAWQSAGLNNQTRIAVGGCTNSTLACGGCTNSVTLALAGF